jgi:hypothetical protein
MLGTSGEAARQRYGNTRPSALQPPTRQRMRPAMRSREDSDPYLARLNRFGRTLEDPA